MTMTRTDRHSYALLGAILLSACGADGGSIASAPTSIPASTPSPTPTPTPGFTPTVAPTENFAAATARVSLRSGGDEKILAGVSTVTVGRDAAGNYLITLPIQTGTVVGWSDGFLRKFQFEKVDAETTSDGVIHYRVSKSGSIFPSEKSYLTIIPAGTQKNSPQYVNFAMLDVGLAESLADGEFPTGNLIVFGQQTPGAQVPVSGSASYSGRFETSAGPTFIGSEDGTTGYYYTAGHLIGAIALSTDFGSGAITGRLSSITDTTGFYSNNASEVLKRIPAFSLAGQMSTSGTMAGKLTAGPGTSFTDGRWTGSFFGPNAAEIGGAIILNSSQSLGAFSGYFGAKKD